MIYQHHQLHNEDIAEGEQTHYPRTNFDEVQNIFL